MHKGICFYFGYDSNYKKRAKEIKEVGFDSVITCADKRFNKQNGKIDKQVELFHKVGLRCSSLHMVYNSDKLPYLWKVGINGLKIVKSLKKDVKTAYKHHFKHVVVHLLGKPSKLGIYRLKRVLKLANKLDVNLAIENIDENECFFYVMDHLENKNLKFCFDSGHNNIWDKDKDILSMYLDKLVCVHLHDNNGNKDQHTLNKYGTIDWDHIGYLLSKCKNPISLDYELMMHYRKDEDELTALKECKKQADELESIIEKYKGIELTPTKEVENKSFVNA